MSISAVPKSAAGRKSASGPSPSVGCPVVQRSSSRCISRPAWYCRATLRCLFGLQFKGDGRVRGCGCGGRSPLTSAVPRAAGDEFVNCARCGAPEQRHRRSTDQEREPEPHDGREERAGDGLQIAPRLLRPGFGWRDVLPAVPLLSGRSCGSFSVGTT